MPRGFVSGIFLASLAVLPLFSARGIFLLLSPFFAILALFANPNAALVLLPAGVLILLRYYSDRRFYLYGAAGALPAAILCYLAHRFYDLRPHYQVHFLPALEYKFDDIHWDDLKYMDEVSPLLWGKGSFVFVILALMAVAFGVCRQWKPAIAALSGIVLLVAAFGFNKVHDGMASVFFPWARMFLAVPFLIALLATQFKGRSPWWAVVLVPMLAAGFFGYKCIAQAAAVERQVSLLQTANVEVVEVRELKRQCERIAQVAWANQSRLVVINWGRNKHLTNYGCSCLVPNFPGTMEPGLDRRTWWLQDIAAQVVPNVLFAGFGEGAFASTSPLDLRIEAVSNEPRLYLLKSNTLRTDSLLEDLRLGLRPH
ncbi:MAG: hypothetical protein IPL52_09945 [Flavobacteriales bacterium]|nr:hypothetical protein [Flavobacteriales bacterium]